MAYVRVRSRRILRLNQLANFEPGTWKVALPLYHRSSSGSMFRIATSNGAIEENNAPHKKIVQPKKESDEMTMAISRVRSTTIIKEKTIDNKPPSKTPTNM